MRECWNWQTGMTKDHVSVGSEGSSPFSRMMDRIAERLSGFFIGNCVAFPIKQKALHMDRTAAEQDSIYTSTKDKQDFSLFEKSC